VWFGGTQNGKKNYRRVHSDDSPHNVFPMRGEDCGLEGGRKVFPEGGTSQRDVSQEKVKRRKKLKGKGGTFHSRSS